MRILRSSFLFSGTLRILCAVGAAAPPCCRLRAATREAQSRRMIEIAPLSRHGNSAPSDAHWKRAVPDGNGHSSDRQCLAQRHARPFDRALPDRPTRLVVLLADDFRLASENRRAGHASRKSAAQGEMIELPEHLARSRSRGAASRAATAPSRVSRERFHCEHLIWIKYSRGGLCDPVNLES
jgi:hypothetical protein